MARSTKDSWLAQDAGDLKEVDVEDVPVKGETVRIRALSATFNNGIQNEAITTVAERGGMGMRVDSVKLDILKFLHGVVEPKFSEADVRTISAKFGPAFNKVVSEINRISGITPEEASATDARFPSGGDDEKAQNGVTPAGDRGSDLRARAGAGAGEVGP